MLSDSRVSFFTDDEIELMKNKVFTLLETRDFKMEHPQVLNIMDKAGMVVDMNTGMIRLPIVIEDEMNGMVQKILSRPVVNEGTMAWDLLSRSELGMLYMLQTYVSTLQGRVLAKILYSVTGEAWAMQGRKDLVERGRECYFKLLERQPATAMSTDQVKQMESIVKKADACIVAT